MDYSKPGPFNILNENSDMQSPNLDISQPFNILGHLQPCALRKTYLSSGIHESHSFPSEFHDSPDTHRSTPNPASSTGNVCSTVSNHLLDNSETRVPEITADPPPGGDDLIDFGRSFGRAERNHRALSILDFDPLLSEARSEEHIGSSNENIGEFGAAPDLSRLQLVPEPPSNNDIFSVEHLENLSRQSPQSSESSPSLISPASGSPMKTYQGVF